VDEFELALVLVRDEARLYLVNPSKVVEILTTTETGSNSELELVDFQELEKGSARETMSELVNEYGVVYITSLTRQGCSGCETQKPLYEALAAGMTRELTGKVRFRRLHVNYREDDKRESWESKRIFGHAAYPTYMIHVKSHVGPLEIYRSVYPQMDELERQIRDTRELAEFYRIEAKKAAREGKAVISTTTT